MASICQRFMITKVFRYMWCIAFESLVFVQCVCSISGNYTSDDKTSLIKEGVLMHKFDHPNVISLLGICLDAGPTPYVILPFMENGSLISYLRKNKSKLLSNIETEEDEVCTVLWRFMLNTAVSVRMYRISGNFRLLNFHVKIFSATDNPKY